MPRSVLLGSILGSILAISTTTACASHVGVINVDATVGWAASCCGTGNGNAIVPEGPPGVTHTVQATESYYDDPYNSSATVSMIWEWSQDGGAYTLNVSGSAIASSDDAPFYSTIGASASFDSDFPMALETGLWDYAVTISGIDNPQTLTDGCNLLFVSVANRNSCNFSESGQLVGSTNLLGGTIDLFAVAQSFMDGVTRNSSFDMTLTLTPVPLPGTAWLIATGIISVAGACRRRRSKS